MRTVINTPTPAVAVSTDATRPVDRLPLWRLYALRFGYLVIAVGQAVYQWPSLIHHDRSWPLMTGVVTVMLAAMSILAVVGIRYPVRMLPLLLFESVWKLMWLGIVALPQWLSHQMDAATREVAGACLWVVLILAVVPWGFVGKSFVATRGDRWR
jgi:hypothetical protein